MTSSLDATIIPITLTVNGRIGLTLWAPPWEDDDGEEWQGFLGDGAKILLFPNVRELAAFVASGEENDLSDHPAWGRVLKLTPDQLRPAAEDSYDLDQVYEWAAGEPDPIHVSALADVVDMVAKIADCCDDGALRRLVEDTPEYAELVDEDNSYQGKEGRKRWSALGDTIADSWERAIARVESWLEWRGDFSETAVDAESVWDRVGAEPIEIVLADVVYFTVRGEVVQDAEGDDTEVAFLNIDDNVAVFSTIEGLAHFCRTAETHRLTQLEWWSDLKEADDDVFEPALDASFDLRKPSPRSVELLAELIDFCDLEADAEGLDASISKDDWRALVGEVRTCFQLQD